ncbi:MAG: MoxR family ATPase [Firmicutes bacterium]|nr:MoxR family ATPase [Bacillota bacterium]
MNNNVSNIIENIKKVIVGKENTIEKVLICLICKGNVLLEDVPGVGKTTMVHTLAKSMDMTFKRIQFTPDLLPSDITGISIYNQKNGDFEFKKGPIFSNIVLADEINRTSPKTQSSLLEAMQENQITTDGNTLPLPSPFIVLATQNPIEYEGTFPLPEAQLDRFMMKISLGYPDKRSEKVILRRFKEKNPLEEINSVLDTKDIIKMQREVKKVHVDESIDDYIIDIVSKTREHEDINLGVSPRGSLALFKASQGNAYIKGRNYVLPDDVKELILPVLGHRIILKPESKIQGNNSEKILKDILRRIKVPVVKRND